MRKVEKTHLKIIIKNENLEKVKKNLGNFKKLRKFKKPKFLETNFKEFTELLKKKISKI